MIDCGNNVTTGWRPSRYIRYELNRTRLDFLIVTNADQDHLSDLEGLWEFGVEVATLRRNKSPDATILRRLKEDQCELTEDIERYLKLHADYNAPAPVTFDYGMGGPTCKSFCNTYPQFEDTNNLSLAVFIKQGCFKMLFPGDLECAGWKKLIENRSFVEELAGTTILMASHHGRESGFCEDIFQYFTPRAVVISDKGIAYDTQETLSDYRRVVDDNGVIVEGEAQNRHVLTTRRDGDIIFRVKPNGDFDVLTSG
ncbi:hypothetical protein YTPLAS18_17930 [Nitrospira sp.]|nr:hypothetical protein YTPLAS18_17930 [Nitrospira sp.]